MSETWGCQENTNKLAQNFNHAVGKMMEKLSKTLPDASFKFGDAYDFVYDVITNPLKYGTQH